MSHSLPRQQPCPTTNNMDKSATSENVPESGQRPPENSGKQSVEEESTKLVPTNGKKILAGEVQSNHTHQRDSVHPLDLSKYGVKKDQPHLKKKDRLFVVKKSVRGGDARDPVPSNTNSGPTSSNNNDESNRAPVPNNSGDLTSEDAVGTRSAEPRNTKPARNAGGNIPSRKSGPVKKPHQRGASSHADAVNNTARQNENSRHHRGKRNPERAVLTDEEIELRDKKKEEKLEKLISAPVEDSMEFRKAMYEHRMKVTFDLCKERQRLVLIEQDRQKLTDQIVRSFEEAYQMLTAEKRVLFFERDVTDVQIVHTIKVPDQPSTLAFVMKGFAVLAVGCCIVCLHDGNLKMAIVMLVFIAVFWVMSSAFQGEQDDIRLRSDHTFTLIKFGADTERLDYDHDTDARASSQGAAELKDLDPLLVKIPIQMHSLSMMTNKTSIEKFVQHNASGDFKSVTQVCHCKKAGIVCNCSHSLLVLTQPFPQLNAGDQHQTVSMRMFSEMTANFPMGNMPDSVEEACKFVRSYLANKQRIIQNINIPMGMSAKVMMGTMEFSQVYLLNLWRSHRLCRLFSR